MHGASKGACRLIGPSASVVILVLFGGGAVRPAHADGIAFKGRDLSSYRSARENEQVAYISQRDGVQHMIVAIGFVAEDDEQGVWILPVPGEPQSVTIAIQDEFPQFKGTDPRVDAKRVLGNIGFGWRAWCLLPLPFEALFGTLGGRGLSIHEKVERWGIHSETLTAISPEALSDYLESQRVAIAPEQLQTLTPYFDGQHVFVVTWIPSVETVAAEFPEYAREHVPGRARTPCIYVTFPTDRPYFPLRPTSAYDTALVDMRLYVRGFVAPQTGAPTVAQRLVTRHYRLSAVDAQKVEAIRTDITPDADFDYTLVLGTFRGTDLVDDLWFDPVSPADIGYANFVLSPLTRRLLLLVFGVLLVLLSYVSGGIAGLLTLRKWAVPAHLGCYNVLSLLGLWFALKHHDLAGGPDGTDGKLASRYCWAFVVVFVILATAIQWTLQAPLWNY